MKMRKALLSYFVNGWKRRKVHRNSDLRFARVSRLQSPFYEDFADAVTGFDGLQEKKSGASKLDRNACVFYNSRNIDFSPRSWAGLFWKVVAKKFLVEALKSAPFLTRMWKGALSIGIPVFSPDRFITSFVRWRITIRSLASKIWNALLNDERA